VAAQELRAAVGRDSHKGSIFVPANRLESPAIEVCFTPQNGLKIEDIVEFVYIFRTK
jgi:hypothetical protein